MQTLQFMLDCERGEGGFRQHLFLQVGRLGTCPPLPAACSYEPGQQPPRMPLSPASNSEQAASSRLTPPARPPAQMTAPGGERWWWSPVLQSASHDVPTMPWGGFLAEEMGLGKVGGEGVPIQKVVHVAPCRNVRRRAAACCRVRAGCSAWAAPCWRSFSR